MQLHLLELDTPTRSDGSRVLAMVSPTRPSRCQVLTVVCPTRLSRCRARPGRVSQIEKKIATWLLFLVLFRNSFGGFQSILFRYCFSAINSKKIAQE